MSQSQSEPPTPRKTSKSPNPERKERTQSYLRQKRRPLVRRDASESVSNFTLCLVRDGTCLVRDGRFVIIRSPGQVDRMVGLVQLTKYGSPLLGAATYIGEQYLLLYNLGV